jgi:hypothetical protein
MSDIQDVVVPVDRQIDLNRREGLFQQMPQFKSAEQLEGAEYLKNFFRIVKAENIFD